MQVQLKTVIMIKKNLFERQTEDSGSTHGPIVGWDRRMWEYLIQEAFPFWINMSHTYSYGF